MDFQFCMQDPTDPNTQYLYEAIIEAAAKAKAWRGMYAFATRGGVNHLIEDPAVHAFMQRGGTADLVVGIDAVTNRQTLERMQELATHHSTFHPRVFWNETNGLFHPKISEFCYADGSKKLIIGSGNLTPGGLRRNIEGFSIISSIGRERLDLSALDEFFSRHAADIRPIDEEALARAALNVSAPVKGAPRPPLRTKAPSVKRRETVLEPSSRILIAQVPAAGGRWSQVHFNGDIIEKYFRVTDVDVQRVYLTGISSVGTVAEEEVRPIVYSAANKNHKIEISAAKGLDYPDSTPPILIFSEKQVRCFDYILLMPGMDGYGEVSEFLKGLPSIGRGLHRSITTSQLLRSAWRTCPLLGSTAVSALGEL